MSRVEYERIEKLPLQTLREKLLQIVIGAFDFINHPVKDINIPKMVDTIIASIKVDGLCDMCLLDISDAIRKGITGDYGDISFDTKKALSAASIISFCKKHKKVLKSGTTNYLKSRLTEQKILSQTTSTIDTSKMLQGKLQRLREYYNEYKSLKGYHAAWDFEIIYNYLVDKKNITISKQQAIDIFNEQKDIMYQSIVVDNIILSGLNVKTYNEIRHDLEKHKDNKLGFDGFTQHSLNYNTLKLIQTYIYMNLLEKYFNNN